MKVLHVLNELKPSGAETMLLSAASHWQEHGVTCELLATGPAEGEFAETLRAAGYRIHHLPRRGSPTYFMSFRKLVRSGRYSVVHQHAEGASYWFGLAALSGGAKLVRTMHNNFSFDGNLRWRRAMQRRHLQMLGTRFVAIAPGVQKNEIDRFGIRSHLVWNWIDTGRFQPISPAERANARARWGIGDQELVLIVIGNCSVVKNHRALIEALSIVGAAHQIRLLHVGLEDVDCAERHQAEQLGISNQITFCGWVPNPRELLAAADLYAMPSLYEGLGLSAVEALGVGLPALLADVPGLRDLKPLIPKLLYAEPDPEALAQALRKFCSLTPAERVNISSEYPKLIQEKFSVARGVREYCDIYNLASGNPATGHQEMPTATSGRAQQDSLQ